MRRVSPLDTGCKSVAALLADAHRAVGGNVQSQLFATLASAPGCFEAFWIDAQAALRGCSVRTLANGLRAEVTRIANSSVHIPDHLAWLAKEGFSREESRQIRYVVEAFHSLEPVFAILTVFAREWLRGANLAPDATFDECHLSPGPVFAGEIALAGDDAIFPCPRLESDEREEHSHPFFRALAVWPRYFEKVAGDIGNPACLLPFVDAVDAVRASVESLPLSLIPGPSPSVTTSRSITAALDYCLANSCEVMVLTSALRHSFIRGEVTARTQRISQAAECAAPTARA